MQDPTASDTTLIFGKYRIIKRLAIGGMGEIFLARQSDTLIDRFVILKSLLPDLAANQTFVEQFLGEARVAATLNHPHIVSIYEVGAWDGIYFIAMEYIDGPDLAKLLAATVRARRLLPPVLAAKVALDAATALEHASDARDADGNPLTIVHRDISPQNIMLRRDGVTKVVDFGIARAANLASRTLTGQVKGKLSYMPPEQLLGEKVDWRADQYALGVVLWELATCERLIKPGTSHLELLETTTKQPMQSPRVVEPGVPEALERVILRMGERDPDDRYQSWADVRVQLREFIEGVGPTPGQDEVAAFIDEVAGEELEKAIKNEEAASPENFLINLKAGATVPLGGPLPDDTPTLADESPDAPTRVDTPNLPSGDVAPEPAHQPPDVTPLSPVRPAPGRRLVLLVFSLLIGFAAGGIYVAMVEDEPSATLDEKTVVRPEPPVPVIDTPQEVRPSEQGDSASPASVAEPAAENIEPTASPPPPSKKPSPSPGPSDEPLAATPPPPVVEEIPERKPQRQRRQGEGAVTLNTQPWTRVTINDLPRGTTPLYRERLTAGVHRVRLVNKKHNIFYDDKISVGADQEVKLVWRYDERAGTMRLVRHEVKTKDGRVENRIRSR